MEHWQPTQQEMASLEALFQQGRNTELAQIAQTLTQRFPNDGFGWNVLAVTLSRCGRNQEALGPAQRAAALMPDSAEAQNNLGSIYQELGFAKEAEVQFQRSLAIDPGHSLALINLSQALKTLGRFQDAERLARRLVQQNPGSAEAHMNLGNALLGLRQLREAEACFRRAISIQPNHAGAHSNLGGTLHDLGRFAEAEASFRRALQLSPDNAFAHNNLALIQKAQGQLEEAVASYRRAILLKPGYTEAHTNLLQCLNYLPQISASEIYAEHLRWGEIHGRPPGGIASYPIDRNSVRRLRVGYVSPDLRKHSVAYFFEPLLREHDRARVEIFCYAEVSHPDEVTARLKERADHWIPTVGLSDRALAQRIQEDRIDILVDLAGHTANSRLSVFAFKPAPVQVSWLGYPNTTGLRTMDYRLVDEITDPASPADKFSTEQLVRLKDGFLCYLPPTVPAAPHRSGVVEPGVVTFGSFNLPTKLSPVTLDAWAEILHRAPRSRLVLKGRLIGDPASRAAFQDRLRNHGIDTARVDLRGWTATLEHHFALYAEIDIALDPFPYNGTTTTCEALWMGVPVVTLLGDRHASRVGASVLTQLGMIELIAHSIPDYVEIALRLASDQKGLDQYRSTLRTRMAKSSLCDAPAFARKVEAAFRAMWETFCNQGPDIRRTS